MVLNMRYTLTSFTIQFLFLFPFDTSVDHYITKVIITVRYYFTCTYHLLVVADSPVVSVHGVGNDIQYYYFTAVGSLQHVCY